MKRVIWFVFFACLLTANASAQTIATGSSPIIETTASVAAVGKAVCTTATLSGGSASTIMTTMVGAPALAGASGAGAAYLLNQKVFNGDSDADKAARKATVVGATLGTAASVGTLAVTGAGPVGLATIGSALGGGMALGGIVVVAAPALVAGALGSAVYWLFN